MLVRTGELRLAWHTRQLLARPCKALTGQRSLGSTHLAACCPALHGMGRTLCYVTCLALALAFGIQSADASLHMLSCTDSYAARVKFLCQGQGTVNAGANMTYTIAVDQQSAYNQLYNINITLRSVGGDADL